MSLSSVSSKSSLSSVLSVPKTILTTDEDDRRSSTASNDSNSKIKPPSINEINDLYSALQDLVKTNVTGTPVPPRGSNNESPVPPRSAKNHLSSQSDNLSSSSASSLPHHQVKLERQPSPIIHKHERHATPSETLESGMQQAKRIYKQTSEFCSKAFARKGTSDTLLSPQFPNTSALLIPAMTALPASSLAVTEKFATSDVKKSSKKKDRFNKHRRGKSLGNYDDAVFEALEENKRQSALIRKLSFSPGDRRLNSEDSEGVKDKEEVSTTRKESTVESTPTQPESKLYKKSNRGDTWKRRVMGRLRSRTLPWNDPSQVEPHNQEPSTQTKPPSTSSSTTSPNTYSSNRKFSLVKYGIKKFESVIAHKNESTYKKKVSTASTNSSVTSRSASNSFSTESDVRDIDQLVAALNLEYGGSNGSSNGNSNHKNSTTKSPELVFDRLETWYQNATAECAARHQPDSRVDEEIDPGHQSQDELASSEKVRENRRRRKSQPARKTLKGETTINRKKQRPSLPNLTKSHSSPDLAQESLNNADLKPTNCSKENIVLEYTANDLKSDSDKPEIPRVRRLSSSSSGKLPRKPLFYVPNEEASINARKNSILTMIAPILVQTCSLQDEDIENFEAKTRASSVNEPSENQQKMTKKAKAANRRKKHATIEVGAKLTNMEMEELNKLRPRSMYSDDFFTKSMNVDDKNLWDIEKVNSDSARNSMTLNTACQTDNNLGVQTFARTLVKSSRSISNLQQEVNDGNSTEEEYWERKRTKDKQKKGMYHKIGHLQID